MNLKKILILSSLPIFILVLSGCGAAQPKTTQTTPLTTTSPVTQQTTPRETTAKPETTATQSEPFSPLPANNKTAIDTEVNDIDADLQAADKSLSEDTIDSSLGL